MKKELVSNAITNIQDEYITEAANYKSKKIQKIWFSIGSVAASLILIMGLVIWKNQTKVPESYGNGIIADEDGVTIPRLEVSLPNNIEADMVAFFIYQGRVYVQDECLSDANNLIGEHLGTVTGAINEWTKKEDYVELSGSVYGDFYSVQGYDPSFMLCMSHDDGTVSTYVNNNGITLKYGSELFEDRLHIKDNIAEIEYQTRNNWYHGTGEIKNLRCDKTEIESFINALNAAEFIRLEDIPLDQGELSVYDAKEIYHLFLKMNNEMVIHLRLFEGGYVNFDGINGICVKMNNTEFEKFIDLLE